MMKFKHFRRQLEKESWIRFWMVLCLYSLHSLQQAKLSYDLHIKSIKNRTKITRNKREGKTEQCHSWQWRGSIFDVSSLVAYYEILTSSMCLYSAIKYTFPGFLESLVEKWFEPQLPSHCYVMGRFIIAREIKQPVVIYISWAHICWRLARRLKLLEMNSFYFLLFTRRDVENYSNFLQTHNCDIGDYDDPILELFHDIMSFKIRQQNSKGFLCKLRPHRDVAAHRRLCSATTNTMLAATSLLVCLASIIAPIALFTILSDSGYRENYPGCNGKMGKPEEGGQLASFFSMTLAWHRLIATFVDILENFIIWTESGFAGLYAAAMCNIVNYDILEYWKWLHKKTEELNKRTQAANCCLNDVLVGFKCANDNGKGDKMEHLLLQLEMDKYELRSGETWGKSGGNVQQLFVIYMDFFHQIKRVDSFISDVISVVLALWTTFFAYCIYFLETNNEGFSFMGKLTILLIWCVTTAFFVLLLALQRNCSKTYPLICSLLAKHRNPFDKQRFSVVLECFNDRKATYSLFGIYPLRSTTYLNIISWSISCFFIVTSTMRR